MKTETGEFLMMSTASIRSFRVDSLRSIPVGLALLLLAAWAPSSGGDHVLEIERSIENVQGNEAVHATTERGVLYLGDGRARFDHGPDFTWILRREDRRAFFVRHAARTYEEFEVPQRLEDLLSAEER